MKRILSYFLPSIGALAMMACDPPEEPKQPTSQTIKVMTVDGLTVAANTRGRDNHTIKIEWQNNLGVTNETDDGIGEAKTIIAGRADMEMNDNGYGISYGPFTVDYHEWGADTKSTKIVADENGVWPWAVDATQQTLWATAGYTNIRAREIVAALNLTPQIASDAKLFAKFINDAYEQYKIGVITLNDNDLSPNVEKETLVKLFCEYIQPPDARVSVNGITFNSIISDDGEWSYQAGFDTATWNWYSRRNGKTPEMRWVVDKYDNDMRAPIMIGGVTERNTVSEMISGGVYGDLTLVPMDFMPQKPLTVLLPNDVIVDGYYWVDCHDIAIVANTEMNKHLIQDPLAGPDTKENSNTTNTVFLEPRGIIPYNPLTVGGWLTVYTEWQMKNNKNLTGKEPIRLPAWALMNKERR